MTQVKIGQVWVDNDPRHNYTRKLKILEIVGVKARVQHPSGLGARTWIRLDRFKPTSNGYKLEQDV